jgi:hypothetical protein
MPQVFVAIGSWLAAGAAAGTFAAVVGTFLVNYAVVLGTAAMLLGSMAMSNRQKKKAKAQYNASQVDRLANVSTTMGVRELVFGRVRKAGPVIFRESTGTQKELFVMVTALAAHEIDGVEGFFINDVRVTVDGGGNVLNYPYARTRTEAHALINYGTGGYPTVPAYHQPYLVPGSVVTNAVDNEGSMQWYLDYQVNLPERYANIRVYTGSDTQTSDARLMSLFPGVWTAAHRLRGIAYIISEFQYDETAFPSGIPSVTAIIRGKRCYDPRTGLTAFTSNPALHIREVLKHPYFGKRETLSAAEESRIVTAANACDVAYTTPGAGGTTGPLYQSACVFPYGTTAVDALDDLTQACAGMWAYAGGEFFLKVGAYSAPVIPLGEKDLATSVRDGQGSSKSLPIGINTHKARADQVNVAIPKIWDQGQDFKQVALLPVKNSLAIADDGQELPVEISMPAVPFASRANIISNFILKDSRDPLMVTANFKMVAYPIELFDNISLTLPRYGWDGKEFIVMSKTFSPEGNITMTMKEISAELYNPLVAADSDGYASNSGLINPWDVDLPGELTLSSGTDDLLKLGDGTIVTRVRVQWPTPTDYRVLQGGFFEMVWRESGVDLDNFVSAPAANSSLFLIGPRDGRYITVYARYRTPLMVTDWTILQSHLVQGKSLPPNNVPSATVVLTDNTVVLKWLGITDADVAGYEVRTSDTGWGSDTGYVFRGDALNCPVNKSASIWYVRAYDTSKNYSAVSTSAGYSFAPVPNPTGVTHTFADTSLTAATVTLNWEAVTPQFPISHFIFSYDSITEELMSTTITVPANWIGNRSFNIKTVDVYGEASSGVDYVATKVIPAPVENFRAQVIDNTVLFYWDLPAKTSLPVSHVVLRRGADWETAFVIGEKSGTFTTVSELAGGDYTYWMAVVDTDGYFSTPTSLNARVNQPPDFIFNSEFYNDFVAGDHTFSNAFEAEGKVFMPVNLTETLSARFTANSWNNFADQIGAGFPLFLQPGLSPGYYEETFDLGTVIGSTSITLSSDVSTLVGTVNILTSISVSLDDSTYIDYLGQSSVFAQNFRYVKIRVTAAQVTAGALVTLNSFSVRLDTKLKTDAGVIDALSTDANGTIFNFNTEFVDILTINPSVASTSARTPTYAFLDSVLSGTYTLTSNVITVNVTGHQLIAGQRVRLAPSSGLLPLGVYTVATVPNADSYTINYTAANTSGNLSTYPNSARFFVWDSDGVRQSNTVSINIRGS